MATNTAASRGASRGFTVVELMIALAVVALLAAIAVPSYLESVRKGRRADAVTSLQQVQQAQERWRANNPAYAESLAAIGLGGRSRDGHYLLSLSNTSAAGYTATATAAPSSPQAGDGHCRVLRLTQAGGDTRYTSDGADGTESAGERNACWNR